MTESQLCSHCQAALLKRLLCLHMHLEVQQHAETRTSSENQTGLCQQQQICKADNHLSGRSVEAYKGVMNAAAVDHHCCRVMVSSSIRTTVADEVLPHVPHAIGEDVVAS